MFSCVHAFDPDYSGLHNDGMEYDIPKLLKQMMDALGGNQSQLAERLTIKGRGEHGLKIKQPQVSRWMRKDKPQVPETKAYARIIAVAQELGVLHEDVRSEDVAATMDKPPPPTIKIRGYVGAGSEAHFYRVADDAFEEVPAPPGSTDQTVALQIRGKSWGPVMDTWLVFYEDVRSPVTPDLIGEACVVGLADDRILIKQIRSNGRGGFDLHPNSTTDEVIKDAEIEWAAKIIGMRPR